MDRWATQHAAREFVAGKIIAVIQRRSGGGGGRRRMVKKRAFIRILGFQVLRLPIVHRSAAAPGTAHGGNNRNFWK
jgi:hypothetical protein